MIDQQNTFFLFCKRNKKKEEENIIGQIGSCLFYSLGFAFCFCYYWDKFKKIMTITHSCVYAVTIRMIIWFKRENIIKM